MNQQTALNEGADALAYRAEKLGYELHNLVEPRLTEAQDLIALWRESQGVLLDLARKA